MKDIGMIRIIYDLLTESEVITGKSQTKALCIDRVIAWSIPQRADGQQG